MMLNSSSKSDGTNLFFTSERDYVWYTILFSSNEMIYDTRSSTDFFRFQCALNIFFIENVIV